MEKSPTNAERCTTRLSAPAQASVKTIFETSLTGVGRERTMVVHANASK